MNCKELVILMQKVSWSGHLFACNHLALLDASARANSGQCALGAPFLKGDEIVDGLNRSGVRRIADGGRYVLDIFQSGVRYPKGWRTK